MLINCCAPILTIYGKIAHLSNLESFSLSSVDWFCFDSRWAVDKRVSRPPGKDNIMTAG